MVAEQIEPAQIVIVGVDIGGRRAGQSQPLRLQQPDLQGRHDAAGDLVLDREDVGQRAVVALGPDLTARGAVDQPDGETEPVAGTAHAAFQHMADPKPGAGIDRRARARLQGETGLACRHEQPGDLRELGDQVLGDALGEIVLVRVAAEIDERQDGDGRASQPGNGRAGRDFRRRRHLDREGAQRPVACLHHALAEVEKAELVVVADLLADGGGDGDAARRSHRLEPRGHVDPVAVDVATIGDDVAEIDADPEDDLPGGWARPRCAAPSRAGSQRRSAGASSTLANSTSAPSPMRFTSRPRCSASSGSTSSRRCACNAASVPSSSTCISRVKPTTSAARIAASLRSIDHRLLGRAANAPRARGHRSSRVTVARSSGQPAADQIARALLHRDHRVRVRGAGPHHPWSRRVRLLPQQDRG